MNILYLHQHFATRQGSGGTRSYEFAQHLLREGHKVTMVTAHRRGSGIENLPRQVVDGIDVISLGGYYTNYLPAWRRIVQFLRFTARASVIRQLPYKPDVVIATSTPLTIGIPGTVLARRLRVPFVFEVRDLWPQAPIELGALKDPVSIWLARRLERWLYRRAARIIALSPGMAEGVREAGTPDEKIVTITNASDTDLFAPAHRDRTLLRSEGVEDKFVAIHAGMMGKANGLDYVAKAARVLKQRGADDIHILITGYGNTRSALEQMVADWKLENVTFTGSIPREMLGPFVSSCDVAITSFANLPVLSTNSPNKLFDGLAAGLPNIVNSPGWTRDLVLDNNAGTYVDNQDPEQLADALIHLRDHPEECLLQGANARKLALDQFDRAKLAVRFEAVLRGATPAFEEDTEPPVPGEVAEATPLHRA